MRFLKKHRSFAVEVRSEEITGALQKSAWLQKDETYFAAGTLCVWDVDVLSDDLIKSYRSSDPESPFIYRRGDPADAVKAVPGWSMPVDD